jgi:hypothetical protein
MKSTMSSSSSTRRISAGETIVGMAFWCSYDLINLASKQRAQMYSISRSQMLTWRRVDSCDDAIKALNRAREKARHPIQPKAPPRNPAWTTPRQV